MGLEHVKHEILTHAEQEAKKVVAAAKEQAKMDFETAHQTVDAFETEIQATLQKELDALERQYAAGMQLTAKKILLQKRREVLDAVFQQAAAALIALSNAEKKKLYSILFSQAKKQCTAGIVFCAKQDVSLVKTLCPSVQSIDIIGGIIVESKDSTVRFDYSFDSVLVELQEKKLQEVAQLLFGKS